MIRVRAPLGAWLASALSGLVGILGVNAISGYTGVALPLDLVTAGAAVLLGLPGVVAMLLFRLALGL